MKALNMLSGAFVALLISANALASPITTLSFDNISANNVGNAAIGEAQLKVEVYDNLLSNSLTATSVIFRFLNIGAAASSITDVYFEDGSLLGIASLTGSGGGVSFAPGASPPDLPAGNNASPAFQVTAGFSADSTAPAQPNGVNPGEWLDVRFSLQALKNTGDVLADLSNSALFGATPGGLRIGIHVQGFADGGSETFVNNLPPPPNPNPDPVPEPTLVWMLGLGLLGLVGYKRKQAKLAV